MNDAGGDEEPLVVAHHHPGRLRVRSRAFEWDAALLSSTERWLAEQPGVLAVSARPEVGSVLVAYDTSRLDVGALLVSLADHARLAIAAHPPLGETPAQTIYDAARTLDDHVHRYTNGRYGLGLIVPVALGIGSVGSLAFSTHVRAPRWDNLLYWAVQFFWAMNQDRNAERRRDENAG
jgi:hypothetical protein